MRSVLNKIVIWRKFSSKLVSIKFHKEISFDVPVFLQANRRTDVATVIEAFLRRFENNTPKEYSSSIYDKMMKVERRSFTYVFTVQTFLNDSNKSGLYPKPLFSLSTGTRTQFTDMQNALTKSLRSCEQEDMRRTSVNSFKPFPIHHTTFISYCYSSIKMKRLSFLCKYSFCFRRELRKLTELLRTKVE